MNEFSVGMISYANMAPYRALPAPGDSEFIALTPTETSQALREGRVLAGAIPVGDLPAFGDRIEFLGNFGIAADGPVGSVLLFSDRPLEHLAAPARVFLTAQSSSSAKLLFLLLRNRLAPDRLPYRVSVPETADAELLIGDEALARRRTAHRPYVIDLAAEWRSDTGLPAVFARWVVATQASAQRKKVLRDWLNLFKKREAELVASAVNREESRLSFFSPAEMRAYLDGMKRVLGARELRGQELFLRKLTESGPGPLFVTMEEAQREDR